MLDDPLFKGRSDHLAAAAEPAVARAKASALDAVNEYNAALREFLVQWAAQLGGVWRRHHWDAVFHYIARGFDPKLELERRILTATYKKRLQLRFLNWEAGGEITLKLNDKNLTLDLTGVVLQPPGQVTKVRRKVAAWLDEARNAVERDPAVLERVCAGRGRAGRRARVASAVAPGGRRFSAKGHPAVRQELETLFHDVTTHVTAMLAHARDGRERFERLVRRVEPTPELVAQWREEVLIEYRGLQAEVRQGLSKLPAVKKVTQAKQTIERLLVTTNPERLRQKLKDVVDLTGRRIRAALRAQVDQLYQAGESLFERLDALARGAGADAGHAGEEVIRELESLFQLTEKVADESATHSSRSSRRSEPESPRPSERSKDGSPMAPRQGELGWGRAPTRRAAIAVLALGAGCRPPLRGPAARRGERAHRKHG